MVANHARVSVAIVVDLDVSTLYLRFVSPLKTFEEDCTSMSVFLSILKVQYFFHLKEKNN